MQEQTVATLIARMPTTAWQRLTVAAGTKGPRTADWVATRAWVTPATPERPARPEPDDGSLAPATGVAQERWVLARRAVGAPNEVAYYLSNAPAATPLRTLAQVAAARWPIEQCFEEAKGETGLDHYEVRHWDSWHRHVTLALLAHTFLLDLRRHAAPEVGGKWASGRAAGAAGLLTGTPIASRPASRPGRATASVSHPATATVAGRAADPPDRPRSAQAPGERAPTPGALPRGAARLVPLATAPSGRGATLPLPPRQRALPRPDYVRL